MNNAVVIPPMPTTSNVKGVGKRESKFFAKKGCVNSEGMFVGEATIVKIHSGYPNGKSTMCIGKQNNCPKCAEGSWPSKKLRLNFVPKGTDQPKIVELGMKEEGPRLAKVVDKLNTHNIILTNNKTIEVDGGEYLLKGLSFVVGEELSPAQKKIKEKIVPHKLD